MFCGVSCGLENRDDWNVVDEVSQNMGADLAWYLLRGVYVKIRHLLFLKALYVSLSLCVWLPI